MLLHKARIVFAHGALLVIDMHEVCGCKSTTTFFPSCLGEKPEQTSAMEQTRNNRDSGCNEMVLSFYKRDSYKWSICVREARTTIWFGFDSHLVREVEPFYI